MEFSTFFKVLRVRWIMIGIFTLVGVGAGTAWAYTQPKVYTATASAIITAGVAPDVGSALASDNYAKSRVKSYIGIASSRSVAKQAISTLGLKVDPQALIDRVTVTNPLDTAVLRIAVTGSSPEEATKIAEAWISGMSDAVDELESSASALPTTDSTSTSTPGSTSSPTPAPETGTVDGAMTTSIVHLHTLDTASASSTPTSPNKPLALELGGLMGFLAGMVIALIRFSVDLRIHSDAELEKDFGRPVIGVVPEALSLPSQGNIADSRSSKSSLTTRQRAQLRSFNEAVNKVRTNLQFMNVDNPPRIIVVTSSLPGEGKSTMTYSLANALAATGQNVVAIDADLRKPALLKIFGLVDGAGLTDVLVGRASLRDVLQQSGTSGRLLVLGPGLLPPNPSELLGSETMRNLIHEISRDSIVLIDSPPLLPVTDASVLAARTDGAIVVVRAGRTTSVQLKQAMQNLDRASGHALGLVLNRVPLRGALGAYYGYQYTGNYVAKADKSQKDAAPERPLGKRRKSDATDL